MSEKRKPRSNPDHMKFGTYQSPQFPNVLFSTSEDTFQSNPDRNTFEPEIDFALVDNAPQKEQKNGDPFQQVFSSLISVVEEFHNRAYPRTNIFPIRPYTVGFVPEDDIIKTQHYYQDELNVVAQAFRRNHQIVRFKDQDIFGTSYLEGDTIQILLPEAYQQRISGSLDSPQDRLLASQYASILGGAFLTQFLDELPYPLTMKSTSSQREQVKQTMKKDNETFGKRSNLTMNRIADIVAEVNQWVDSQETLPIKARGAEIIIPGGREKFHIHVHKQTMAVKTLQYHIMDEYLRVLRQRCEWYIPPEEWSKVQKDAEKKRLFSSDAIKAMHRNTGIYTSERQSDRGKARELKDLLKDVVVTDPASGEDQNLSKLSPEDIYRLFISSYLSVLLAPEFETIDPDAKSTPQEELLTSL